MKKTGERLDYEGATIKFWMQLYNNSPEAAFRAVTQFLLDLEWDSICQGRVIGELK